MRFHDEKRGEKVKATMLGFAGENNLQTIEGFKEFFSNEFHPEKGKSFTDDVRTAIKNESGQKLWALVSTHHVEAVTDEEYRRRQP